jgi:hypothetical protein
MRIFLPLIADSICMKRRRNPTEPWNIERLIERHPAGEQQFLQL